MTRAFDRSSRFFMEDQLALAEGKTLIVASSEIDALRLESAKKFFPEIDVCIVGLRGFGELSSDMAYLLKQANAKNVIFVGEDGLGNTLQQRFGSLAFQDPHTSCYRCQTHVGKGALPLSLVQFSSSIDELFRTTDPKEKGRLVLKAVLENSVPFESIERIESYIQAKSEFSDLLRSIEREVLVATGGLQSPRFNNEEAYELLAHLYDQILAEGHEGLCPSSLSQFLSARYSCSEAEVQTFLFEGVDRESYYHSEQASEYEGVHWNTLIDSFVLHAGLFDYGQFGIEPQDVVEMLSEDSDPGKPLRLFSRKSIYDRMKYELGYIDRSVPVVWNTETSHRVQIADHLYFKHSIDLSIAGESLKVLAYGRSKLDAQARVVAALERQLNESEMLRKIVEEARAGLTVREERENVARAENCKGSLHQLMSRLKTVESFTCEQVELKHGSGVLTTLSLAFNSGGGSFVVTEEGSDSKRSEQLASQSMLTILQRHGIDVEGILKSTKEEKPQEHVQPRQRLQSLLQQLAKSYEVTQPEFSFLDPAKHPNTDDWVAQLRFVVKGLTTIEVTGEGTARRKDAAEKSAIEQALVLFETLTLPDPDPQYHPTQVLDPSRLADRQVVQTLHEKLQKLAARGYEIDCPEIVWDPENALVEARRFGATRKIKVHQKWLEAHDASSSKDGCRRELARSLLLALERYEV
ncbi:MAG: hypothetical protein KDD42_08780, partial [Bdellovibrionales bacterium]|nr:hypothetical protein [Bdellovibrionales bacterium]